MIIKYFAWIKNITRIDEEKIDDSSVNDIKSLKKFLIKKYPKLKRHILENDILRIAVNLEIVTSNCSINQKDEIAIFPPVSGG